MKNTFFEYYILSDEERIKRIWNDAIIVLDANVLLNLYRYSEETKNNLFEVLEYYNNRLWIPYQVGWEYHQNRISVYMDMNDAYDKIASDLKKETVEFIKKLNLSKYSRHPKIKTNWFEEQIRACSEGLREHLLNMKNECTDVSFKDEINERITELFDGKVGSDFDDSTLKNLFREGKDRYSEKIPPGYCDAKDKKDRGNRHLYGDLIWWKQVIKEAREKENNVILVTDDVKEDWYERVKGKTIGPRKELLQEFRANTQKDILIYTTPKFLEYAKEKMSISVNQETISEAKEINRENEAIGDVISSVSETNKDEVIKVFSENPWMSAESFLQTYLNPIECLAAATPKYSDIWGKNTQNPMEAFARLTPDYSDIINKSVLNPIESLATATSKYSDILGKNTQNPMETFARLTPGYSDIINKSVLNPIESLATATSKYSDILGKNTQNPMETFARLTPDYSGIINKSISNPLESLASISSTIGLHHQTISKNNTSKEK